MTHVRQEFTFAAIRQLSRLTRRGILLDGIAQMVQHVIDVGLETVHFTCGIVRCCSFKYTF